MIKTIRAQLLIVNTAVLAVIFTVMSVYLVTKNTEALRTNLRSEVRSFATLATPPIGDAYSTYGESGTDKVREAMKTYLGQNEAVVNATVVDLDGNQLFSYKQDRYKVSADQASTFKPIYDVQDSNLGHVIYPYFGASGAHSFSIVYTVSNAQINKIVHAQTMSLLAFSIGSLLLTSVITYAVINRLILRPIRLVSQQASIISGGNLEQQIVATGNNEIAALGRSMNTMAESLKASIAKLQEVDKVKSEFMAITSHNLRTPLTIISGYLENIDLFDTIDELKSAMQRIGESVKRLGSFAEDVLIISRFELGESDTVREPQPIGDFLQRIIDDSTAAAKLKDLTFTADVQTNAKVLVSPPHMRSAIWNFIDNAFKFTPAKGTVSMTVREADKVVKIAVKDTGIGIAKQELPKLFTKFHRATSVEKYDYEGTGIGLYASKIIILENGGKVDVESEEGKGSTFTITLPIAEDNA